MARDDVMQMSAKAQSLIGLPEGFKAYTPFPFSDINAEDSPIAIKDEEFTYIENFVKIGNGNLRTVWDVGAPLYTAPSGALVFAAGTIQWAWGLDDLNAPALRASRLCPAAATVTRNFLARVLNSKSPVPAYNAAEKTIA